jgi:hypothetical protein
MFLTFSLILSFFIKIFYFRIAKYIRMSHESNLKGVTLVFRTPASTMSVLHSWGTHKLYEENNKLQDWKQCIYTFPLSSTHLWLRCSNYFNPSKKNSFACEVILELRKAVVAQRSQITLVGQVFQNFKVKICQFLAHNGCLVKSSFEFNKQDSFWKLASKFGDQLLLQFVKKCSLPCLLHPLPGIL